ncbi:mixed lineage kinase domain-like protein [Discoglossus pictus]
MDALKCVFLLAKEIYDLCDKASTNKKQCKRLKERIESLLRPLEKCKILPEKSEELEKTMEELQLTLKNAKSWVIKYSNRSWFLKTIWANKIKTEFEFINDRLDDNVKTMSLLLSVEQREDNYNEKKRKRKYEKALQEDMEELKQYCNTEFQQVRNTVDHHRTKMQDVSEVLEKLDRLFTDWEPKLIDIRDLKKGQLLVDRPTYSLYKGEYQKMPVAIKVLKGQMINNENVIKSTFDSECKTMKKFECSSILRVYGICIDKTNHEPCYSLVLELCEKGTLRDLLKREPNLSWDQRLNMALDAARALFRLHHTEKKAILHGSLSSFKFLVDRSYSLKLSEFELSKTESSMRRTSNVQRRKKNSELAYIAPETFQDINAYDKYSEIYSLGIVIWEITSGRAPLQGMPDVQLHEIYQKRCEENEAFIPADCPTVLRDIIIRSQARDPNQRPSAGVIVDKLMEYLNEAETQTPPESDH